MIMISSISFRPEWPAFLICRHPELIENYAEAIADETQTWVVHHRLETHTSDGERRLVELSKAELDAFGMYYDRPPEELIFLTRKEHLLLHNPSNKRTKEHFEKAALKLRGQKRNEQTRKKMGEAHSKKVLCVETGEVFESILDARMKTGIKGNISQVCLGKRKTTGGFHWKYIQ